MPSITDYLSLCPAKISLFRFKADSDSIGPVVPWAGNFRGIRSALVDTARHVRTIKPDPVAP
jgi:hypothetical protein